MSQQRSLRVTDPTFGEFNTLKIRIAVSMGNTIPTVSAMVNALLAVGNNHYDELIRELTGEETTE